MNHCCDGVILGVVTDRTDREALWGTGGLGFRCITLPELGFHSILEQLISSTVVTDSHTWHATIWCQKWDGFKWLITKFIHFFFISIYSEQCG